LFAQDQVIHNDNLIFKKLKQSNDSLQEKYDNLLSDHANYEKKLKLLHSNMEHEVFKSI
jgi:uncharacterized protein YlxW (UPF0749 family)